MGHLPVWSPNREDLDLHRYNSGVACCAVLHFLTDRVQQLNYIPFSIIVGRQNSTPCLKSKPPGDSVREQLASLGVKFEERALGGMLVIPSEELCRPDLAEKLREKVESIEVDSGKGL